MKTPTTIHHRIAACAAVMLGALPLAAGACGSEPYVGEVCTFAFDWCPQGYLPADGRSLTIQQNQLIFALISYQYGGSGNNFNLPDLRGRSTVGIGQGQNFANVALAQKVGQQQLTLTPAQTPVAPHAHPAAFVPVVGPVDVAIPASQGNLGVAATLPVGTSSSGATAVPASGQNYLTAISGQIGASTVAVKGPYTTTKPSAATLPADVTLTGSAGSAAATVKVNMVTGGTVTVQNNQPVAAGQAVSTQSPGLGMTVCIAVLGLYPQRP
ncbi:phage tail protein [Telluria mixta]|uniref:Phage tail protein n=1 Tax=Telluria mixta TaxID=34071 RepID=A0ABT2BY91_9BURK|nr:phage tail protein [Telluria mixta]MCS0630095.1 phage tail protein [Telluria mixta]WEM94591.1 phage tail protein [Telluria mixta]